jgi:hypothetical protein
VRNQDWLNGFWEGVSEFFVGVWLGMLLMLLICFFCGK